MCFPLGLDSRKSTYNVVDTGLIPGSGGSPGEGNGNPIQYSCLENFMERRLVGYSSWGHKESDMTEQLTHFILKILPLSDITSGSRVRVVGAG